MRLIVRMIAVSIVVFCCTVGPVEAQGAHCTESIIVEMSPGTSLPAYTFKGTRYPAYPLDVLNKLLASCPNTKEIDFILDPKSSAKDVLIAYGAAEKSQFERIKFFISGASYYYPFTIGDGTSKPVAK